MLREQEMFADLTDGLFKSVEALVQMRDWQLEFGCAAPGAVLLDDR
jgi:hypothetical protein